MAFVASLLVSRHLCDVAAHPWWLPGCNLGRLALLAVVALWSVRLSLHTALRQRHARDDSRFMVSMARGGRAQ